jgi:hypothetical protein
MLVVLYLPQIKLVLEHSNIKLPYNVETRNIGGGYNTSTYEFTAPVSGSYFFHAYIF